MSLSEPGEIENLKNSGNDVIVRVYDSRFGGDRISGAGWHPSPGEFAEHTLNTINRFPTVEKFQLHNEPNHLHHIEGWGADDHHARDFNKWLIKVIEIVKASTPRPVQLLFPGLAIPHNDHAWLSHCKESIDLCDGLGVHLYWQNRFEWGQWMTQNHLSGEWGLRYRYYHNRFPDKPLYCLEAGNSNGQQRHNKNAHMFPIDHEKYGHEYNQLIQQAQKDGFVVEEEFVSTSKSICEEPPKSITSCTRVTSYTLLRAIAGYQESPILPRFVEII